MAAIDVFNSATGLLNSEVPMPPGTSQATPRNERSSVRIVIGGTIGGLCVMLFILTMTCMWIRKHKTRPHPSIANNQGGSREAVAFVRGGFNMMDQVYSVEPFQAFSHTAGTFIPKIYRGISNVKEKKIR